jgi:glyoxylase-like metal-dependent hydrolase (beta-lactamase superfamily II)
MRTPEVRSFFDPRTRSFSHVVADPATRAAAIIDPVLDYDADSGRIAHASADGLIAHVRAAQLRVEWIIETHVHADHLSAASYLRERLGARIGIGARVREVQAHFGKLFDAGSAFRADGSQFDHLFADGETYRIGELDARTIATPGHTPTCMTHLIGDAAFVGDTLFNADYGTARCDFPGGDAHALYRSVQALFALPDATRVFFCHDYPTATRTSEVAQSTIAEEKQHNIHLHIDTSEAAFVQLRTTRDATLSLPKLMLPAVQVNIHAGELPPPAANGIRYLKIPLDTF